MIGRPRRRAAPGTVRLSDQEHVELLRGALRAADLERDGDRLRAEGAGMLRELVAHRLIEQQTATAGLMAGALDVGGMLADLPQCADGSLHEPAFLALLGQHILEHRLGASIPTTTTEDR